VPETFPSCLQSGPFCIFNGATLIR